MEENTSQYKNRRRSAWYGPLVLVLLSLVVVIVLSLLFRVRVIEVVNGSEYTNQEIIDASGIEKGENLFFIDRFSAASMLFAGLPYLETVTIERSLPNKLILQVEGTAVIAYVRLENEYWLIDKKGKVLERVDQSVAEEEVWVKSITPVSPVAGEPMLTSDPDAARLSYALPLLEALQAENMLESVTYIDMENAENPVLRYEDRLTVYLGPNEELPYKLALFRNVLSQLAAEDIGTLRYTGGAAWTFSPE